MTIEEAKAYTGDPNYWGISGRAQLELLKGEGLLPYHHVLEVGCGSLNASIPLIDYLDADRYVGLEPKWILVYLTEHLVDSNKRPLFRRNPHFDVWGESRQYDYVIGHSVFSHAPEWQLIQCLHNLLSVTKSGTKLYFSLHLGEDSGDVFWKDSGNTFYSLDTIKAIGAKLGYDLIVREDIRIKFMKTVPVDYHDWIEFIRI